jgi:hypothetical protein
MQMSLTLRKWRYKLVYALMKRVTPGLYRHCVECGLSDLPFTRPMIARLRQVFSNTPLIGVEIGVAEGKNAENMFKTLNITHLYLIDPYEIYVENGRLETRYSNREAVMKAILKPFWNRITFLKLKSQDAVNMIPQVNFVYIDGSHDYDAVRRDIQLYASKVSPGGLIGGHDISVSGVAKAVQEFADHNHLAFISSSPDWYMQLGFRQVSAG